MVKQLAINCRSGNNLLRKLSHLILLLRMFPLRRGYRVDLPQGSRCEKSMVSGSGSIWRFARGATPVLLEMDSRHEYQASHPNLGTGFVDSGRKPDTLRGHRRAGHLQ